MKKIILATILAASVSATAFAVGNSGPSIPMPVKLLKTVDSVTITTGTDTLTCTAPSSPNSNWVCKNASGGAVTVSEVVITGGSASHGYTETCTAPASGSAQSVGYNCERAAKADS